METRDLDTAQHEAAHVVVGVALGLRLHRAAIGGAWPGFEDSDGHAWFAVGRGSRRREALALMYAAGVAWDQALRYPAYRSAYDYRFTRELCSGLHGVRVCVRAAAALLGGLMPAHARVTRALLEHDITGAHILAMCHDDT